MAESINGSTIPPVSRIVDDRNAIWTLVNGVAVRNGQPTISSLVKQLVYLNKIVYQQNIPGNWWRWDNNIIFSANPWAATTDPRPVPTPKPSPTPLPTPHPLPIGETHADFYLETKLVGSGKLVRK